MSYKIYITETAINDMDTIYEYIAYRLNEPQIAADLIDRLEESIVRLEIMHSNPENTKVNRGAQKVCISW